MKDIKRRVFLVVCAFFLDLSIFLPLSSLAEEDVVILSSANGKTTGQTLVILIVPPENPLAITQQPVNISVTAGQKACFSISATGKDQLSYQWQINCGDSMDWVNIGMNSTVYISSITSKSDSGYRYRCIVTDANGSIVVSDEAVLTVFSPPPMARDYEQLGLYGLLAACSLAVILLIVCRKFIR